MPPPNEEADPKAGPVALPVDPTTIRCVTCGHEFTSDWEKLQHFQGRHHYSAWVKEDGGEIVPPPPPEPVQLTVDNPVASRFIERMER
jgi:hypothetical protein